MQQALLEKASDYFTNALKPGTFREGEEGTLHFPEDDLDTWQIMIYWLFHRKLPGFLDEVGWELDVNKHEKEEQLLVRCWCLGDKYGITDFQNVAMWWLIKYYEYRSISSPALKQAFANSARPSKLRKLATEEAVRAYKDGDSDYENLQEMDGLDGLGFFAEFMSTLRVWNGVRSRAILKYLKTERYEQWGEFMVGGGTKGLA